MLIRETLRYLPAQLLSPLAQLASMVLWTHWLGPAGLAVFTLATAAQELAYTACLGWFSMYALRFMPPASDSAARQRFLRTENAVMLVSSGAGLLCAALVLLAMPAEARRLPLWAAIAAYFVTRAASQHYGERARAQSHHGAYSTLQLAGPVGGLALGWLALQHLAATPELLLGAYALAQAVGLLLAWPAMGMRWRLSRPDGQVLRAAGRFGLPMLTLATGAWVGENHIRYIVQWHDGAAALGLMIVGWSLGRRCASVSAMLVTTASFPLASRLINEGRRADAMQQLRHGAVLLLAVLVPATAAVAVLGGRLVEPLVAPAYRQLTGELLALAVVGGALRNVLMHAVDQLLQLEMRWRLMVALDVAEVLLGVPLTLLGLRLAGLHGAVIGQGLAGGLMLAVGIVLVRRRLGFHWPWDATLRIGAAGAVMTAAMLVLLQLLQPAGSLPATAAAAAAAAGSTAAAATTAATTATTAAAAPTGSRPGLAALLAMAWPLAVAGLAGALAYAGVLALLLRERLPFRRPAAAAAPAAPAASPAPAVDPHA